MPWVVKLGSVQEIAIVSEYRSGRTLAGDIGITVGVWRDNKLFCDADSDLKRRTDDSGGDGEGENR